MENNTGAEPALEQKLAELDILKQSISEQKDIARNYYDQLLRLKAEFENFRKRMDRERGAEYKRGKISVMVHIIDVLDEIQSAESAAKSNHNTKTIIDGLNLIKKEMEKFFKFEGMNVIESVGKKFDPNKHEVVEQKETENVEEDTIIDELKKGYDIQGTVIRPAMVCVAKKLKKNETAD